MGQAHEVGLGVGEGSNSGAPVRGDVGSALDWFEARAGESKVAWPSWA